MRSKLFPQNEHMNHFSLTGFPLWGNLAIARSFTVKAPRLQFWLMLLLKSVTRSWVLEGSKSLGWTAGFTLCCICRDGFRSGDSSSHLCCSILCCLISSSLSLFVVVISPAGLDVLDPTLHTEEISRCPSCSVTIEQSGSSARSTLFSVDDHGCVSLSSITTHSKLLSSKVNVCVPCFVFSWNSGPHSSSQNAGWFGPSEEGCGSVGVSTVSFVRMSRECISSEDLLFVSPARSVAGWCFQERCWFVLSVHSARSAECDEMRKRKRSVPLKVINYICMSLIET